MLAELKDAVNGKIKEKPATPDRFGRRIEEATDKWNLLDEVKRLLARYEHLSHLKLPNFWIEAMVELHKYEYLESFTHEFITIPAKHINTIVHRLLREAPCASMLQRYRRRDKNIDPTTAFKISNDDKELIIGAVKKYNERLFDLVKITTGESEDGPATTLFTQINGNLLDQRKTEIVEKIFEEVEESFKKFNMGTALTEMRIPKTYQGLMNEIITNTREMFNKGQRGFAELVIQLFTAQLIYDLNNAIFKSGELVKILQDIKS